MKRLNDYGETRPTESRVKKCGRTFYHNDILWLSLSGTGMEFEADGSFCDMTFVGDASSARVWVDDLQSRIGIHVDGQLVEDFLMDEEVKTVRLFHGEDKKRRVRVVKLSESAYSTIGVRGIKTDGNVSPAPEKGLKIEFIGDSITCGYGVEGANNDLAKTSNENFAKSYAYLAAEKLDADYSAVAYSGYGVISGHTTYGHRQPLRSVPRYYSKFGNSGGTFSDGMSPSDVAWDHREFVPDIVVINLGTNDYFYTGDDTVKTREFMEGYIDFLKMVRNKNQNAYMLCTLGMVGDELFGRIEEAVAFFSREFEDDRISCMKFDDRLPEDGYGVMMHPSAITHEKAAEKLVSHVLALNIL
ncbi:GDSL-like Lipase/Acylhydrolase family protein [Dethiosulfatibacter aminovorans DSM 17477]|uniref:GDSL-like Lipase/Acylhydrolase family protein n=1 Tax=Dethiosulfatibacter aminovorans DSM 17477 TaxID=1121476 RepID=A0A1M6GL49_9FIRM|nr:SGNH/GDSL hydrolase family protein [Dethiosulfatibacter aminovorans]SHJ10633.1 GDSL-like Lipase/Acylhydrolase family protein [Dethiosulfatibacter aminovorans DSM 17477]